MSFLVFRHVNAYQGVGRIKQLYGYFFGQLGFTHTSRSEKNKGVIESALKKAFAPEFLNRIDDVIVFQPLVKDDISKIVHIELRSLLKRMELLEYHVQLEESAVHFLADKGFDPKFGVRPLQRAIQRYIEDPLATSVSEPLTSLEASRIGASEPSTVFV